VFPAFKNYNERIRTPGGFRLFNAASERQWLTPEKRARFIVARGVDDDLIHAGEGVLALTTVRSHDQYNTTIYSLNDRYRGVSGRRDVVFVNPQDLAARGLKHGDRIDVLALGAEAGQGSAREVLGFVAVAFDIAHGSVAMYFPEGNLLVALENHDAKSGTPAYKSVAVTLRASSVEAGRAA
jgi:anaerobic selenocysteine-containing dehydrogenase